MVNIRGRVVAVMSFQLNEKKKLGWELLPPKYLTDKGLPKQTYFPQYDRELVGKPIPFSEEEERRKEVLNVELL